jgi:hypothetical protein
MLLYNISDFIPAYNLITSVHNRFTHTVTKGFLAGSTKIWFCKEMEDPTTAKLEHLAQEFFRLIIPHQPETRIACNYQTGTFYILSEEVQGYHKLPKEQAQKFTDGSFTGLGQAMIVALLLEDIDFKNGNVSLDCFNRIIKIDGDWCFAERMYKGDYNLTPDLIENLPYPKNYKTHHWLDITKAGVQNHVSSIVNPQLSTSLQFRAEVNQAMLKICLIPDSFIESFVDSYTDTGGQRFVDFIKSRRDQLTQSALENNSFKSYLNSAAAHWDAQNILGQMKSFNNVYQPIIAPNQQAKLESDFSQFLSRTPELAKVNPFNSLRPDCELLMNEIKAIINPNHLTELNSYEVKLSNPCDYLALKSGLTQLLSYHQCIQLIAELRTQLESNDDFIKLQEDKLFNPPCDYFAIKTDLTQKLDYMQCGQLLGELGSYFDPNDSQLTRFIESYECELSRPCNYSINKMELTQIVNYIQCRQLIWDLRSNTDSSYDQFIQFMEAKLSYPCDYLAFKLTLSQISNYIQSNALKPQLYEGQLSTACDYLALKIELPQVLNYIHCKQLIWEIRSNIRSNNNQMNELIQAHEIKLSQPCDYSALKNELNWLLNYVKKGVLESPLPVNSNRQVQNILAFHQNFWRNPADTTLEANMIIEPVAYQ